jgi:hypothetical protein
MRKVRSGCKILVGKSEGKRPLRRHKRKWENIIKIDLKKNWGCGHSNERPCFIKGRSYPGLINKYQISK